MVGGCGSGNLHASHVASDLTEDTGVVSSGTCGLQHSGPLLPVLVIDILCATSPMGCRLLCWCATSGLVATADALLRMLALTAAPAGLAGALELAHRLVGEDGLSLLHRALQSRSLPMVQVSCGAIGVVQPSYKPQLPRPPVSFQ